MPYVYGGWCFDAEEDSGLLPPGHPTSWDSWRMANNPSKPGDELEKLAIDGIAALQGSTAVANLGTLVEQASLPAFLKEKEVVVGMGRRLQGGIFCQGAQQKDSARVGV